MNETSLCDQWECQRVFLAFMQHLDAGEADAAVGLVSRDVIWHRQGKELRGPDAIRAVICDRAADRTIRHHLGNIVVTVEARDRARSKAYYAVYTHDGMAERRIITGPERVGDYHATYVRSSEEWRIASLRAVRVFEGRGDA